VGSNDGTFLKNFNKKNSIGFEPSLSVHKVAKTKGINSINNFFNLKNVQKFKNKFDIIVGSNCICHIPDQSNFIKAVKLSLKDNGKLIFEEPYLGSMYEKTSYDQIYDEHIYMFSASSVKKIYYKFGLKLIDVIPQKTHGGSMRYIISKNQNDKSSARLKKILQNEKRGNIDSLKGFLNFKKKVFQSKIKLIEYLKKLKNKNIKICGYGATSKSTTILNFCNIKQNYIDCIFDTTKDKIGKFTPGTGIPIHDYKFFKKSGYKYVFLFAWNHKNEIMKKESKLKNIKWFSHVS